MSTPSLWSGVRNIVSDILPMIMPGEVRVKKSSELDEATGGRTEGMVRKGAIVGMCEKLCASGMYMRVHAVGFLFVLCEVFLIFVGLCF